MSNKMPMQVYFTRRQKEFLAKKSEETGIPQSELVRQAMDSYISKEREAAVND